jgi:hypothetical protein
MTNRKNVHDRKRENLIKKRDALAAQLEAVTNALRNHKIEKSEFAKPTRLPVRVALLDALDELGSMAYSRQLLLYIKARWGREISPARFGTASKDEERAFDSRRSHPVYLAHGLTSQRFEPIKRLWARSDWPIDKRIVAPTSGRVLYLHMTARMCEVALKSDELAVDPEMMRILAADHARDLPGIRFRRGSFELEVWRDTAIRLLDDLAPRDQELRSEAAERLAALTQREQLFGAAEQFVLTALPGVSSSGGTKHRESSAT